MVYSPISTNFSLDGERDDYLKLDEAEGSSFLILSLLGQLLILENVVDF